MKNIKRFICTFGIIALFSFVLSGVAAADAVTYHFTINTSSIAGQSGWLDFQFNPGGFDSQLANASMTGFGGDSVLDAGTEALTGDVTGVLAGPLGFDNGSGYNDYFQSLTFGNVLTFDLHLSGPALTAPNGTSSSGTVFAFSLYDAGVTTALLTTSPGGDVLRADVNLHGTTDLTTYPSDNSGSPSVVGVPEPASLSLLISGGIGLLFFRKRRS